MKNSWLIIVFLTFTLLLNGCITEPTKSNYNTALINTNTPHVNKTVENNTNQTLISYKCHQNNFTMAFILVAKSNSDVTPERIQRVNEIKNLFSSIFYNATLGLATMDTSYPLVTIISSTIRDTTTNSNSVPTVGSPVRGVAEQISQKFYETNQDNFDFIAIFPATANFSSLPTSYEQAQNFIKGIGLKSYYDRSKEFGSNHKLLGSAYYRDYLENIDSVSALNSAHKLLHETGHQWCCYAGTSLGILDDERSIHFNSALDSPYKNGAYISSRHWISNGDGTYRTNFKGFTTDKYHPFALYFMGLYTENNFDFNTKFKLYNATFNDRAIFNREISITDIIAVEGKRECVEVLNETPTSSNNKE